MKRLMLVFVISIILLSAVRGYSKRPELMPVMDGAGIRVVDSVSVVTFSGNPRQTGFQHVKLLNGRMQETEDAFIKLMPKIPGGAFGRWVARQFVMFQVSRIEKYLEEDEIEELKGMMQAAPEKKGGYKEILYYHVLQDIGQNYACTGAAAAGSMSQLSGPIAGRNFDMDLRGMLQHLRTVFYYRPESGYSYASVAWPAMVGAVSGMNERGVCVMIFSAKSENTTLVGVPVAFIARRVLKRAENVGQAIEIIRKSKRMGPNIFLLADTKKAAVVEFDAENIAVSELTDGKVPVANHFQSELLASDEKNRRQAMYSDSRQRFGRMSAILNRNGRIGITEMLSALRDHNGQDGRNLAFGDFAAINNVKGAHSVIFDPASLTFWVSSGRYAYGSFVGFRLGTTGLVEAGKLAADQYPESVSGKGAIESDNLMAKATEAEKKGLTDEAYALFTKAANADQGNYLAMNKAGEMCLEYDKTIEAFYYFDKAVSAAPSGTIGLAQALADRGEVLTLQGSYDSAKADFQKALDMNCSEDANKLARKGLKKIGSSNYNRKPFNAGLGWSIH